MYEKHFGLKSKPFGSKADGAHVFVGPQQTKIIASLQKGLGAPDAVVTVTGPVGVGKTTIVNRALETLATGRTAAQIGRMHLSSEEVIDLLMGGFGIKKSQAGSIRRFAAFRRQLQAQRESGIPVAIVIEDAERLGAEALAEVEALTAADAGDASSANIILMGQAGLHDLLSTPGLARLKQRVRLRQKVAPLSLAEVQGYLKHAIREAGGDYDTIFDSGVAEIVLGCSEGVPRMINTLCETALTTAMEEHSSRVTAALMSQIASDAFGYEGEAADTSNASPAAESVQHEPKHAPVAEATIASRTDEDIDWEAPPEQEIEVAAKAKDEEHEIEIRSGIGRDIVVESGSYPGAAEILAATAALDTTADESDVSDEDTNLHAIPELINDTQPELPELQAPIPEEMIDIPVLTPELANSAGKTKEAADAESSADIESTQTLAQPVGLSIDEPVSSMNNVEPAAPSDESDESDSEDFDLDAALSPEVDSTNVMPGLTPNLDKLASENPQPEPTPQEQVEPAKVTPAPETVAAKAALETTPTAETKPTPQPESVAVAPAMAQAPAAEPPAEPMGAAIPDLDDLPTLSNSMRVDVKKEVERAEKLEPAAQSAPELPVASDATTNAPAMRDPSSLLNDTDRKSDIDALEAALAAAKNGEFAEQKAMPAIPSVNGAAPELTVGKQEAAPVPEITLDEVIADQQKQNDQLDKFRAEIGSASSLEDISDVMAETLFGCEAFDDIAADVLANPPEGHDTATGEEAPSPVKLTSEEMPSAANDSAELSLEEATPTVENPDNADLDNAVPLNQSTALRIDMLNKMKSKAAAMAENVELGEDDPAKNTSKTNSPQPEPIERQINTSMTQTLEALKFSKVAESVTAEKPEKKSGGLFSRFKKSS
jgi:type II secretory pathway predicted ATPase ExeA